MMALSVRAREVIFGCLVQDQQTPFSVIARLVGVHRSTVSREVRNNGGRFGYSPSVAELAAVGRRRRPKPCLDVSSTKGRRVRDLLLAGYAPYSVSRHLRAEGMVVAVETIYQAVYTGRLGVPASLVLRTGRNKRHLRGKPLTTNMSGNYLGDYRSVHDRGPIVGEPGHWEGDLIIGANAATAMITLIEKVSHYTVLIPLRTKTTREVVSALDQWASHLPEGMARSLTWDQGSEMTLWPQLEDRFKLGVFFCDRRSPWQRGTSEQNNRTIRFWFPKGTSLADPTGDRSQNAMHILNTSHRRSLNGQTPAQVYAQLTNVR